MGLFYDFVGLCGVLSKLLIIVPVSLKNTVWNNWSEIFPRMGGREQNGVEEKQGRYLKRVLWLSLASVLVSVAKMHKADGLWVRVGSSG